MFEKARLKLTAWYLLIIMVISIGFSLVIYRVLDTELTRVERTQRLRQERMFSINFNPLSPRTPVIDPEVIEESKSRLSAILLLANLGILGAAGILGYFLAGRTLKPIREMVDEQNRFIADASHELRTPLTSLRSEIEVSLRDKKLNLLGAKDLLKSNLEEVNNLQYLSDNLIKLAQYKKSNGRIFTEVNIAEIIREAQKKVSNLAKRKNIYIKNLATETTVLGEKQSLIELFVILLDNSIKYSAKNKQVEISSKNTEGKVVIAVKDQGLGIEPDDIPYLFNRFYRADKARTKTGSGGYGLGLSIAKQIIEKHDGSISVTSKLGKGTIFTIQLPKI